MHIVVIGSGIGGVTFSEEILKRRQDCKVTLVTRETHGYYSRPLLSHGFTREDIEDKIIMKPFAALEAAGITVKAGVDVTRLDRAARTVEIRDRETDCRLSYDKLVFATGSAALIPPPFRSIEVRYYVLNSLDDLKELRSLRNGWRLLKKIPHWAVIGGGLIGCEVASDLAAAGDFVHLFHAMPRLMERQLVDGDSKSLLTVLENSRIKVELDCAVQRFETRGDGITVIYAGGERSGFDALIIACGFNPRIDLAREAGLAVNRGIRVDQQLTTSDPDIFAIGDVAECADGKIYAYVTPIRNQAIWLSGCLSSTTSGSWEPPFFKPKAKVHGFNAEHPYLF
ncbi:MAG: FAD-dependent oxidoreductase [Methylococcaceae bacterium]|nr:FAD-dependent oxidoreductase [Methylococcaceae bacterium]MCI0668211.1 FAD-dependent oxidoreductase [Methylococcaceae bacterium]